MAINKQSPYLEVSADCIACGWCTHNCPVAGCITFEMGIATIHQDLCIKCKRCIYVCPVNAIKSMGEEQPANVRVNADKTESYDVVVIGAGMGGMLAACQLAQTGKRILLVENLSFLGGRFSGFPVDNAVVSSGALHTIPHGDKGPFAQALRRCGIKPEISRSRVFCSFYVNAQHIIARKPVDALRIFPTIKSKMSVVLALLRCWWTKDYKGTFGDWLLEIGLSDAIRAFVDRFFQFALSITTDNLPYPEGRKVIELIIKYGFPGVPKGGALEITRQLENALKNAGVTIRRNTRALSLLHNDHCVNGVTLLDRRQEKTYHVEAQTIISNIGPDNTFKMWEKSGLSGGYRHPLALPTPAAVGFKLQVLCPKSLIDHNSIMFCLDTQSVAGIVQVSNGDPNLAPPGKHLLMSHQTLTQDADWQEERQLALDDWRTIFGTDFDNCEILGSSHFPEQFPVNWASQGHDVREQILSEYGLWLVGDGMKPEGLMMVEGVAANAESVVRQILENEKSCP